MTLLEAGTVARRHEAARQREVDLAAVQDVLYEPLTEVRPGALEHSAAMALSHAGWAVRLRLPRWDDHVVERLEHAGIETLGAPGRFRTTPLEVTLTTPDDAEALATDRVARALRGWTVLLPRDFVSSGPC